MSRIEWLQALKVLYDPAPGIVIDPVFNFVAFPAPVFRHPLWVFLIEGCQSRAGQRFESCLRGLWVLRVATDQRYEGADRSKQRQHERFRQLSGRQSLMQLIGNFGTMIGATDRGD